MSASVFQLGFHRNQAGAAQIQAKRSSVARHYRKMQLARFSVLAATACAFAPAPRAPTPVRLHGAYEDAVGSSV